MHLGLAFPLITGTIQRVSCTYYKLGAVALPVGTDERIQWAKFQQGVELLFGNKGLTGLGTLGALM